MNIGNYVKKFSEDLQLQNYGERTIINYASQVELFLKNYNNVVTKPSEITEAQIKQWLLQAKTVNSRKHRLSALKLFYKITGKQPLKFKYIPYPREEKKLPIVLSQKEIQALFNVCENVKHKVILSLLYAGGLRVSELINLKWENIDRKNRVIHIRQSKGKKDRQVMLPEQLINLLEKYWKQYHSKEYVLNGQDSLQYSERSINNVLKQLGEKAGVKKRIYAHLIRHCTMTHLLEAGTDISIIQKLAGHSSPKTTQIYTHISTALISNIQSPLSYLKI